MHIIESTKGNKTCETLTEVAAWLSEMQPAFASVDGVDVDVPPNATESEAQAAIEMALGDDD